MSAPSTNNDDPLIGRTLGGRFRIVRQLGEGGIGAVYAADHLTLGRNVALKVLHQQFTATPALRTRFEREARALSKLSHPNIVTVVDFGNEEGTLFLVMELVEGETLGQRLRRDPPSMSNALEIMRQILRALAYAHGLGIVHRDLKPGNVLVRRLPDGSEHVTVLDFGLAKFLDEESSAALTKQGAILGTPAYMAPEQSMGDPATAPADVYAATLILFEILTGKRPYSGRDAGELLRAHLLSPIPRLVDAKPELAPSAELEALVRRGLDKKASGRFPDAQAMLQALDALPELRASQPQARMSAVVPAEMQQEPATVVPEPPQPITVAVASVVGEAASPRGPARHPLALRAVAGAGLLLVVMLSIVAIVNTLGDDEEPTAGTIPNIPVITVPTVPDRTDLVPEAAGHRTPARNPWLESVPAELKPTYDAIARGENPSRGQLRGTLYPYAARYRNDPRANLLLGHTFVNRGWEGDAMDEYSEAIRRDSSSRGDPRVLRDLVEIAQVNRYERRAADRIVAWYGREALPAVTARIAQLPQGDERERLESLKLRLESATP